MFTKALSVLVLAGVALAQTFSIATPPSIQQCQPAALSWTGGTGPYNLVAIPAGQVSAAALTTIASIVNGNSFSWTVNLAQGTAITLKVTDSLGNIAYSSPLTVQTGSTSCGSGGSSASGSAAASAASSVSVGASASSSIASVASSQSSAAASASSAGSSLAASASMASTMSASMTSSSTSRASAASSTAAASSTGAGSAKAAFNVPFLALAAALGCAAFGGFALLA
ncbi:uncharacterized protein MKK02DRAFT_28069 [Dioszegia hungarica]|uniref:Uncharacterized protein n=1 Tax=Dioszegia hungarica TaxID=4972 RepID=A0AA38H6I7_9TREE|nr:uncharacterized protein MKK02DRAFT_28069 [Dioszegia hungarica]KAI9634958.1 hypothetical protein MKK02DRAFT_28069 [Dioszegia hungarica]